MADRMGHDGAAQPWSRAWARAAVGARGFYTDPRHAGPGAHFRTSVHVGEGFHRAVATLLLEVDARLDRPPALDLVDVGAGRGELAAGVLAALPATIAARVRPVAVDVRERPDGLDPRVQWLPGPAPDAVPAALRGLVVAHEWLDDVPLDVVEVDGRGRARLVLVDDAGREQLGPALDDTGAWRALGLDADQAREWLARWWLPEHPGDRAEIGAGRDAAWVEVVRRLDAGTALAVDYGHTVGARPRRGSLTAYLAGRALPPVPDGRRNLTAHVALDSLAAASGGELTSQRSALGNLGVGARLPPTSLAAADPVAYAAALARASDASELLDPAGLGGFGWVRVDVG